MKANAKKILAILLALTVAATLAVSASAAAILGVYKTVADDGVAVDGYYTEYTTGDLEIFKTAEDGTTGLAGAQFDAYKLFDVSVNTTTGTAQYTPTTAFQQFFTDNDLTAYQVSTYSTAELEALRDDVVAYIATNNVAAVSTDITDANGYANVYDTDTNADSTNDATSLGWFLIVEAVAPTGYITSNPFFASMPKTNTAGTAWEYDYTATPKNATTEITKDIVLAKGTADETLVKDTTEDIGDTINYRLQTEVPTYPTDATGLTFTMKDTMSKGLTFTAGSLVVTADGVALVAGTDYTLTVTGPNAVTGETTLDIALTNAAIIANAGAEIVADYAAVLNADAVIGGTGNPNAVTLEYTNNPETNSTYETPVQRTIVYTYGIDIHKINEADEDLEGVKFALFQADRETPINVTLDADGYYYPDASSVSNIVITDATGTAKINGLDIGTYVLEETETLDGYNLLPEVIIVNITAETVSFETATVASGADWFSAQNNVTYYIQDGQGGYVALTNLQIETVSGVPYAYAGEQVYTYDGATYTPVQMYKRVNASTNADGYYFLEVTNTQGFTLPGTGGIGTYIFTAAGIIIIAVAGGLYYALVIKKKKGSANA